MNHGNSKTGTKTVKAWGARRRGHDWRRAH
jgi:hypothetical protein